MNKQELIKAIIKRDNDTQEALEVILEDMLPDFNPNRIDEERIKKLFEEKYEKPYSIYTLMKDIVEEYNATLPEPLKPLPKDVPENFLLEINLDHQDEGEVWRWIVNHYGTPPTKSELPSVEEFRMDIINTWFKPDVTSINELANYISNKYSLHPREWWEKLKEGDYFNCNGQKMVFSKFILQTKEDYKLRVESCTPYVEPTADDIIKKHNLSDEEVRAIREGKA